MLKSFSPVVENVLHASHLIGAAGLLADSRTFDNDNGEEDLFPATELNDIAQNGLLTAALPVENGGAGLGIEAGSHRDLLQLLKETGRANLSLGRIYEGHINALQLISAYGRPDQLASAASDCRAGKLFAVWNTDSPDPVRMTRAGDAGEAWQLSGRKAFASGARRVDRPLVMAERYDGGRQMCLLRKESIQAHVDTKSWNPPGMKATESYQIDFSGTCLRESDLIGKPNDYYAEPLFRGGSIRTSAVLLGGAEALFQYVRDYLRFTRQTEQPLQQMRMSLLYTAIEAGRGWLDFAAREAERGLRIHADPAAQNRMTFAANASRVAIEDICPDIMRLVCESVGARGMLPPFRFGALVRDLTMFLRQPNPDECSLQTGRYLLSPEGAQFLSDARLLR